MRRLLSILTFGAAVSCVQAGDPKVSPDAFAALDRNGDGYIGAEEARTRRGLSQLMVFFDANFDGRLSRGEYRELVQDALHAVNALTHSKAN